MYVPWGIARFTDISLGDSTMYWWKWASLGEMTQAHFSVPNGFVISTQYFGRPAQDREQEVLDAFDTLGCSFVAVRSSGTMEDGSEDSFAGQFASYLFVTRDTLIQHIVDCHDCVHSERMRAYCEAKQIDIQQIKVAVIIQKMVNSESAGVCFTIHPLTWNREELLIEAWFGIGESVVSGLITPDNYIVHLGSNDVQKTISSQETKIVLDVQRWWTEEILIEEPERNIQKLSDTHIQELARRAKEIESHYGMPMDIEWAVEDWTLYILQARPITNIQTTSTHLLQKEDYVLTFWVSGMSILVTDMCKDMYKKLKAVFMLHEGKFKQYFRKDAFEQTMEEWLQFYSDEEAFDIYQKNLLSFCADFKQFFTTQITSELINKDNVKAFFLQSIQLLKEYNKMNFEYTDKAFALKETNTVIAKNLEKMSLYKDQVRTFINEVFFEPQGYFATLLKAISCISLISVDDLETYLREEVVATFDHITVDSSVSRERKIAFISDSDESHPRYYTWWEALTLIRAFEDEILYSETISGTIASRGVVRWRVKLMNVDYSNLDALHQNIVTMHEGDILVAETTAPELIGACKKAWAIVTDMGWLMSHAAIVSRELQIPCIVWTKVATRLLQDGDFVEVDADNGVVRIIEKIV